MSLMRSGTVWISPSDGLLGDDLKAGGRTAMARSSFGCGVILDAPLADHNGFTPSQSFSRMRLTIGMRSGTLADPTAGLETTDATAETPERGANPTCRFKLAAPRVDRHGSPSRGPLQPVRGWAAGPLWLAV